MILIERVTGRLPFGVDRDPDWDRLRKLKLADTPFCQACPKVKNLHVHHIIPVHVDKSKELEWENLIVLCKDCHFDFGHGRNWKLWNVNIIEDARFWKPRMEEIRETGT